ncbi:MAG: hypothetical protein OXQ84_13425 [bacterium]|nr:hypothetical protein [bacterium]
MTKFVVDTNVAIVANRRSTHADETCQLACAEKIVELTEQGIVIVDTIGLIVDEYGRALNHSGAPGLGDAFFKHVVNHQHGGKRVQRVCITCTADDCRGFEELPENSLDRSDRKFLAVAVVAGATILNATDSDWAEQTALVQQLCVEIEQLCPQHARK